MIFNLGGGAAAPKLTSIAVTTQPTKKTYNVGEYFSKSGMVVTAYFDDGSSSVITGYSYSPTSALNMSTKTITISYTHEGITKTATVSITMRYKIYDRGTKHVALGMNYGTEQTDQIYVRITSENEGRVYTSNKISLAGCSTLKAVVATDTGKGYATIKAGIKSSTDKNAAYAASGQYDTPYERVADEYTISCNIKSYVGTSYYVVASSTSVGVGWNLRQLWLE